MSLPSNAQKTTIFATNVNGRDKVTATSPQATVTLHRDTPVYQPGEIQTKDIEQITILVKPKGATKHYNFATIAAKKNTVIESFDINYNYGGDNLEALLVTKLVLPVPAEPAVAFLPGAVEATPHITSYENLAAAGNHQLTAFGPLPAVKVLEIPPFVSRLPNIEAHKPTTDTRIPLRFTRAAARQQQQNATATITRPTAANTQAEDLIKNLTPYKPPNLF